MARDPGLEEIIRGDLESQRGITEKPMFGGLAWLLNGNLLCGARQMSGWVRVGPTIYGNDRLRRKLIDAALTFARSLPEK